MPSARSQILLALAAARRQPAARGIAGSAPTAKPESTDWDAAPGTRGFVPRARRGCSGRALSFVGRFEYFSGCFG